MFRAPTQTPQLCTLLDDLQTRDLGRVARHLGIARSTLTRYRRTGNAPRLVQLALFWETRWGSSVIDCDLVNLHQLQRVGPARGMDLNDVHDQACATIGLTKVPMPSISTSHTSPGFMNQAGLRLQPTPAGVPVAITSPGDKGVKPDT